MSLDAIEIKHGIEHVAGEKKDHDIFLFALSTCHWCKKGKKWLKERRYEYHYVDVDKWTREERRILRDALRDQFNVHWGFPIMVIDKVRVVSGYKPPRWEEILK